MKRLAISITLITLLTAAAALVTWKIVGPPDRAVACDQANLPGNHVCLSTVREWKQEEIVWVDARPRELWEKDGIEGSVLLNDQEDWFDLEPDFMMGAMNGFKTKVVVYCNRSGCESSTYVADQIRERHAEPLELEVFVLEGGINALKSETN